MKTLWAAAPAVITWLAILGVVASASAASVSQPRGERVPGLYADTGLFAQRVLKDPKEKEEEKKDEESREEEKAPEVVSQPRRVSPALAFVFSAGVPGAGQFYNGNRRGIAYLAVEAVAWIAYFSFRSSGNSKEDDFKEFAGGLEDGHWLYDTYRGGECWDEDSDSLIVYFAENDPDHYYEDIGKLPSYACGWDTEENRQEYRDLRNESNDLKSWSRRALMVVFLNHLASGIDAFITARSREMKVAPETELQMNIEGQWDRPRAVLRLVRHW